MNSKQYVLGHDFGYCNEEEREQLNKLKLRNIDDLKIYINDLIPNIFEAHFEKDIIKFNQEKNKAKLIIKQI